MGFWLTFFMWIASFLLTDYFRPKLPGQEPSGEGDFQAPTSTEGRKIPQVVGGTVKVKGPNTLWRGNWEAVPVTIETGVVFKRDEEVGFQYNIALALGQFFGPSAGMTAVYIGDDKVWDYVADNGSVPGLVADVNLPDLWGGETKGGGFVGRIRAFNGQSNVKSTFLDAQVTNQSAWPGMTYVVITDLTETGGANIGEQNQLRDIRIEWQCFDTLANGGLGNELGLASDKHIIGRDANPIACAYRVLSDPEWSINLGEININNFQAAANTCFDEGIGYSQLIDSELEAFEILADIEKHIDGYIGPNPTNGLMEVTLARNDYTPANEFQADESNILGINDYAKPEWPQTKNEVKVRFVNREKDYSDDHAVAQDMAGRLIAGKPQSVTVRFPGLRDATAANAIVARTARVYFWPLSKFQLELDRTAWEIRPGSVIVVNHPDINAVDLATRVTKISVGDPVKQSILAEVVEDVFGAEIGIAAAPEASGDTPPNPAPVAITKLFRTEAPRWMFDINNITPYEPRLLHLVGRDSPNTSYAISEFRTRGSVGGGNFNPSQEGPSGLQFSKTGTLRADIGQSYHSNNDGGAATGNGADFYMDGSNLGGLVGTYNSIAHEGMAIIDPGGANEEIVQVGTIVVDGAGIHCQNVIRGIGDSAQKEHVAGEDIAFIANGYMQPYVFPGDLSFSYSQKVIPTANGVEGTETGFSGEEWVTDHRYTKPYPPALIRIDNLSTTNYFAPGTIPASGPGASIFAPTSGVTFRAVNRRFDTNAIYGANGTNEVGSEWPANSFSDVNPTLKWFMYDLTLNPSPVRGDEILSGTVLNDDRNIPISITQAQIQALANTSPSPIDARFEFVFENGTTLDEVLLNVESKPIYVDRLVSYLPAGSSREAFNDTSLLLHFEGFTGTTQVIDYSPFDHPVTLVGDAEIDASILEDTGLGEGTLAIDGIGDYASIPADAAFDLNCADGFTIQCRVRPPGTPSGDVPLITQWDATGNDRAFWFGWFDNRLQIRISTNGTNEFEQQSITRTWTAGVWYEVTVVVTNVAGDTHAMYYVDGVHIQSDSFAQGVLGALHSSAAPVLIGADEGGDVAFGMHIDEVRIVRNDLYLSDYTMYDNEYPGRNIEKVLHCNWENAADAAKTYTSDDLNRYNITFPATAVTEIDDSQSKFGTKSLRCSGVNDDSSFDATDGVKVDGTGSGGTYSTNFDFDDRDFTMECFVRLNSTLAAHTGGAINLMSKYNRGPWPFLHWYFYISKSDALVFTYRPADNSGDETVVSSTLSATTATWYHCAVVRKDGVVSLFFEGNRVGQNLTDFVGYPIINEHTSNVCLGRLEDNNGNDHQALDGWLDEVRILNGIAAYDGATYTVPTAAFPVDPLPEAAPIPPAAPAQSNWQPTNL